MIAVAGAPTQCKECGSRNLYWFSHNKILNAVEQGRLNTNDVGCVFVLGCAECSETLHIVKANEIASLMNQESRTVGQEPIGRVEADESASTGTRVYWNQATPPAGTLLYAAPPAQSESQPSGHVPDGVWEALQRIIENSALHGPASNQDAILVARYRRDLLSARPPVGDRKPSAWLIHWSHSSLAAPEATTSAARAEAVGMLTDPPRIDPLFAGPALPAVDLRQFRPIVQKERTRLANSVDQLRWQLGVGLRPEVRAKIKAMFDEEQLMLAQADELLALIDGSKAVQS